MYKTIVQKLCFSTLHETKNQNFMNWLSPWHEVLSICETRKKTAELDTLTLSTFGNEIAKFGRDLLTSKPSFWEKKQQNSQNWRGCFSPIHESRKISKTGEWFRVCGFQNGCDKYQNAKGTNNHQTNKLKLVDEQLKHVYKCALPLTTT
jgi:hypothetical protein